MKRYVPYIAVVLAIVFADRMAKLWAVTRLKPVVELPFIEGLIRFVYVENRGAAFGFFASARWFLVAVTPLVIAGIVYAWVKEYVKGPLGIWGMVFVIGGALGNLIDRLFSGYVVDLLEFQFVTFAVFNVADIFVTTGGVMICVCLLFPHEKQPMVS